MFGKQMFAEDLDQYGLARFLHVTYSSHSIGICDDNSNPGEGFSIYIILDS